MVASGDTGAGVPGAAASGEALAGAGVASGSAVKLSTSFFTEASGSKSVKPLAASVISSTELLQVGHLGLAHRLLELALEFRRHAPDLAHVLADGAQHAGQFLRADGDQRDDRDDDKLAPTDIEHGFSNSKGR